MSVRGGCASSPSANLTSIPIFEMACRRLESDLNPFSLLKKDLTSAGGNRLPGHKGSVIRRQKNQCANYVIWHLSPLDSLPLANPFKEFGR